MKFKLSHDDVIKWKHFPRSWPFVQGIHRSPVNSPHKGQWRGALMFSLICTRINGWVNNGEAGDLRRHHFHYDVTVMIPSPVQKPGPSPWFKSCAYHVDFHDFSIWPNNLPRGNSWGWGCPDLGFLPETLWWTRCLWAIQLEPTNYSLIKVNVGSPHKEAIGWWCWFIDETQTCISNTILV